MLNEAPRCEDMGVVEG